MGMVKHKEAFCLMLYRDDENGKTEVLWNSRDGVTPFVITSIDGNSAKHINWEKDSFRPDWKPQKGTRIFVDTAPELVALDAINFVKEHWNSDSYPLRGIFEDQIEAIDFYIKEWCEPTGRPWVITV